MPNQISNQPVYSGGGHPVGSPCKSCDAGKAGTAEKKPEKIKATVCATLFFDGTKNNRANVKSRTDMQGKKEFTQEFDEWKNQKKNKDEFSDNYNNNEAFRKKWQVKGGNYDQAYTAYCDNKLKTDFTRAKLQKKYGTWVPFMKSIESYENDETNVVKLDRYFTKDNAGFTNNFQLYIEGQGTLDGQNDSTRGYGLGRGPSGTEAKALAGVDKLMDAIKGSIIITRKIETITLNCFGFSRGAAAARNFIYWATRNKEKALKNQLTALGYEVGKVKINFAGLFDTVSSFGPTLKVAESLGAKALGIQIDPFENNTEELHLDAVSSAGKVVQLASADEHRKYFSLTNINSAANGTEIFLPGVHCDVGGAYLDKQWQEDLVILDLNHFADPYEDQGPRGRPKGFMGNRDTHNNAKVAARLEDEKNRLVREGWMEEDELFIKDHQLIANRRGNNGTGVRNVFDRIPLQIMAKFARESGLCFKPDFDTEQAVDKELTSIKSEIDNYISRNESSIDDWKQPSLGWLRHDYLHCSSFYHQTAGSYDPNFEGDALSGVRKRIVYDG